MFYLFNILTLFSSSSAIGDRVIVNQKKGGIKKLTKEVIVVVTVLTKNEAKTTEKTRTKIDFSKRKSVTTQYQNSRRK